MAKTSNIPGMLKNPEDKTTYPFYASVYVDIHSMDVNRPFTYGVPEELKDKVYIGCAVSVEFGRRRIIGYITDLSPHPGSIPADMTIKPVNEALESDSLWDKEMLALARWMEHYYGCNFISALKVLIPGPVRIDKKGKLPGVKKVKIVIPKGLDPDSIEQMQKKAPVQAGILAFLKENPEKIELAQLIRKTSSSYSAVYSLEKKGLLETGEEEGKSTVFDNFPGRLGKCHPLTGDQKKIYDELLEIEKTGNAEVALLHGVTGSGKTEIYLQFVQHILSRGKEALILVPEISLTPQAVERFRGRFAEDIGILHSRLTNTERRQMWWKIRNREVRVVLGARSAVFAPLENIGVIVVDEEHESSYKQESDPRYHARQVAVKRAMFHKCPVILGSATPSLEVYHYAVQKKYHLLELPRRIGQSVMPRIEVVNLKKDFSERRDLIIGDTLRDEIRKVLASGEQIILFINRRGFSAFLLCLDCGKVIKCPYCDITLTFHKTDRAIKCHYCDYQRPAPDLCPFCDGSRMITPSFGIQKVEEELSEFFPGATVIRMDKDTTSHRDSHYQLLKQFADRRASILLGTQMIAKGLDFPGVTLVGVLQADISLNMPDFHSLERTFQILVQVAGRAGRREHPGKVIIQSYNPDLEVIDAVKKQDYREFFLWESGHREKLRYPPFSHVINLLYSGANSGKIREYSLMIGDLLRSRKFKSFFYSVLGPAPCPVSRIKSRYRWHLMIKGENVIRMVAVIRKVIEKYPVPSDISFAMDVDPLNLM